MPELIAVPHIKIPIPRISLDEWLAKYLSRYAEFRLTESVYLSQSRGLAHQCTVRQTGSAYISSTGFGNTTAEAFWDAADKFNKATGGIYA